MPARYLPVILTLWILTPWLLPLCSAWADPPSAASDPPQDVRLPLFNGENLDGWHVLGCQAEVQQGLLVLTEGNSLVRTDHRYGDFILELQWRARKSDQWDSGIFFRCELPPEGRPWPRRYQADLRQGKEGNVAGLPGAHSQGLIQPGQWNRFKLTVVGPRAELQINGQPAWEAEGIEPSAGYIGLQAEVPSGGQFEFREISVTELDHQSLFNGRNLDGWEGAGQDASRCWQVQQETLVCTGQPGPWLRSSQQYADFNLRLQYKLKPGGNSGVYVRVPEDGKHHGDQSGIEVQILDDHAQRYQNLKPYQYCGSLYAIAPSTQHVGRPAGQWNSLEINCQDTNYRVIHNGVVIVEADADSFAELKRRRLEGFLGLQNHSEEVWFRHLRIGPPD